MTMPPPPGYPGPIRTDGSNAFANHTMRVRVPAIIRQTLTVNPTLPPAERDALEALRDEIEHGEAIKPLPARPVTRPDTRDWYRAYAARAGESWHGTDWFFAETFAYRRLIEAVRYFETELDPFLPMKRAEYAGEQHQRLFELALGVSGTRDERLHSLIGMDLWGNRVDLSYAESQTHGMDTAEDDLLADDRERIMKRLHDHPGVVHVVADNAGSELTLDLTLIDALLYDDWARNVVLHVKFHPTFVSDATAADVHTFINACARGAYGLQARSFGVRLQTAAGEGRFSLGAHTYWTSAQLWWEMPDRPLTMLREASLTVVKGDANYRRVVGDAYWPHETPFAQVVAHVGIPVACIRTLKSDPLVGLAAGAADRLETADERWRWSGRRGVIQAHVT
jgi:hypothetical protein